MTSSVRQTIETSKAHLEVLQITNDSVMFQKDLHKEISFLHILRVWTLSGQ